MFSACGSAAWLLWPALDARCLAPPLWLLGRGAAPRPGCAPARRARRRPRPRTPGRAGEGKRVCSEGSSSPRAAPGPARAAAAMTTEDEIIRIAKKMDKMVQKKNAVSGGGTGRVASGGGSAARSLRGPRADPALPVPSGAGPFPLPSPADGSPTVPGGLGAFPAAGGRGAAGWRGPPAARGLAPSSGLLPRRVGCPPPPPAAARLRARRSRPGRGSYRGHPPWPPSAFPSRCPFIKIPIFASLECGVSGEGRHPGESCRGGPFAWVVLLSGVKAAVLFGCANLNVNE